MSKGIAQGPEFAAVTTYLWGPDLDDEDMPYAHFVERIVLAYCPDDDLESLKMSAEFLIEAIRAVADTEAWPSRQVTS